MLKCLPFFLIPLFLCQSLTCQTSDISQYKARYERRPYFEIQPQFGYESQTSDPERINLRLPFQLAIRQNTEVFAQSIRLSGNFILNKFREGSLLPTISNNSLHLVNLGIDRQFFDGRNRFWGYRGNLALSGSRLNHESPSFQQKTRTLDLNMRPGLFAGLGRIEYAEDAQLANFMITDLIKGGAISDVYGEESGFLAERITEIIGDRTFGPRRRRIQQLKSLYSFFEERGIEILDEFQLFAILNDNWVYANRIELPHGSQLTLGIDGIVNYLHSNLSFTSNYDALLLGGQPYVSYHNAKIVRNKASRSWLISLSFEHRERLDEAVLALNPTAFQELKSKELSFDISYSFAMVPISRTLFSFKLNSYINSKSIELLPASGGAPSNYGLTGSFYLNYFINGQFRFQLNGLLDYNHLIEARNGVFRRLLQLNLQYAFF